MQRLGQFSSDLRMTTRRAYAPRRAQWFHAAFAAALSCAPAACRSDAPAVETPSVDGGALAAAQAAPSPSGAATAPSAKAAAVPTAREELGRAIFFDETLSTPPGTSCASCHDPRRAFSGNHGSSFGVAAGSRPGHFARRNTPSVLYMKYVPSFHFALEDDDDVNESPFGGFAWNGRADSVAEFARLPLLDSNEMNNASEDAIAGKLRAAPYASTFAAEFPGALGTARGAVQALGEALQAYLTSDAMAPFTSRFDDYLRGTGTLTDQEMRGLAAFKSPEKGACSGCHQVYERSKRTDRSLFTDFGYDAVAVPRNRAIPANADPSYSDVGLCERKSTRVPSAATQWCGFFRTPSLRNVAVRERFMHNGAFTHLRDVVVFYATRATAPQRWYPPGDKFDDVPAKYKSNVNVMSLPYNRREGAPSPLDDGDIDAIVAFLKTLTDAEFRDMVPAN
jgi:cytochrome c peroxidase